MQIARWLLVAAVGAVAGVGAIAAIGWADGGSGDLSLLVFAVPTLAACAGLAVRDSARSALVAGLSRAIAGCVVFVPIVRDSSQDVHEPLFAPEVAAIIVMVVALFPLALFCLGVWVWRLARHPEQR